VRCAQLNTLWLSASPEARSLVLGLLERDPAQRLTASQALQHPWFGAESVGAPNSVPPQASEAWLLRVQASLREEQLERDARHFVTVRCALCAAPQRLCEP